MRTAATNRRLRTILTGIRTGSLVPNPAFQRRLVWSNRHKVAFLETVLAGLPFPEVFIAAGEVNTTTGEGTEVIVDGQQRVTTLFQYFVASPDLKVPPSMEPYAKLSEEQKSTFLEYEVVVRDLGSLTEDQTRDLFYRINSTSYSLNAMEVNNARFDGALKQFCDGVSDMDIFASNGVFSAYDAKRMNDVKWALTLLITMMSTYFNRDTEHELYLSRYNDELPQASELRARLNKVVEAIDQMNFTDRSRVWQKSDLFTLMVELDRHINKRFETIDAAGPGRLHAFYDSVDLLARGAVGDRRDPLAEEYFAATRSGTNDRSSRLRRGRVIYRVMTGSPDRYEDEADLFS